MNQLPFVATLLAITLVGCGQSQPAAHSTFKQTKISQLCSEYARERAGLVKIEPANNQAVIDALDCAHKNAFLLASGTDSAETIAESIESQSCQLEVAEWTVAAEKADSSTFQEVVSKRISEGFRAAAVMEVLRARAGHCSPPEISN